MERLRRLHRENERLFERLVEGEKRFRALARSVWDVQEEERRRVAHELHDGLGQTLTALKMRLEGLAERARHREPVAAEDLETMADLAGSTLGEARRLAHLLRPQMLDDLGLFPALRWLARNLDGWAGLSVALELPDERDERLDPDLETVAFRVVQEALTNAVKHSGANGATVSVERVGGGLRLRVTDDGRGLQREQVLSRTQGATGFGLRGIRDRVELAGGRFELRTPEGGGTELEVELPVEVATRGDVGGGV